MFHSRDDQPRPSIGHGLLECGTLGGDDRHQFVPRFNERLRPFVLKLRSQGVDIDSGLGQLGQHFLAIAAVCRQDRAHFPIAAESQRLIKTEATEPTLGMSPASMRRSIPRKNASAAARYCSLENRRVTLIGMPAKIASSIAGRPSLVPGILMNRLRRAA